jgi:hypothetical protein
MRLVSVSMVFLVLLASQASAKEECFTSLVVSRPEGNPDEKRGRYMQLCEDVDASDAPWKAFLVSKDHLGIGAPASDGTPAPDGSYEIGFPCATDFMGSVMSANIKDHQLTSSTREINECMVQKLTIRSLTN